MAASAASFGAFLRLSRPHFLLGGFLMYGLGAAHAENIDVAGYVVGQLMVSAAQITAHYVNEYADVEPDRAVSSRTWFSGGSGVLVAGTLLPIVALRAGVVSSGIVAVAAALLAFSSPVAALLGLVALVVSWVYSMPPLRLLATGYGELVTSLVVTVIVPVIGVLAQNSTIPSSLWWAVAPLFVMHIAMMLSFEVPDLESDAAAGKRVLAVRIGLTWALRGIVMLYLLAAALSWVAAWVGHIEAGAAAAVTVAAIVAAALTPSAVRHQHWHLITSSAVGALVVAGLGTLLVRL